MAIVAVIKVSQGAIGLTNQSRASGGETVMVHQQSNGDMEFTISSASGRREGNPEVIRHQQLVESGGQRPPRPGERGSGGGRPDDAGEGRGGRGGRG